MRIGIDARMYGPQARGLGRYVQKLVDNLTLVDQTNEYYIYLSPANWDAFQTDKPNFFKVLVRSHWYSLAEQLTFPIILFRSKLDLMHFPHFNVPLLYRKKFMVTIHDLIVSHYPDSRATTLPKWLYKLKLMAYHLVINGAIIRSAKIIAVSNFTRQDIERFYPQVADKIEVTHEGFEVEHQYSQQADLTKYRINKPYLLCVGAAYPHKNLYRLLQAWKLTQIELVNRYQLVMVGQHDFFYNRLIDEATEQKLLKNVIFTDYVKDNELPALYKYSLAYVFPSYLEGFGLPAIEAQSYGTPVLAANNSSLPEVLGNSALYFDPFDINDISHVLVKIIKNTELRDKLVGLGYQNCQQFSWQEMALKVRAIYEQMGS
ncbi:MAG: glycosyltransferase family 1 protein [Candidatus Komeilibacteria bacterium]